MATRRGDQLQTRGISRRRRRFGCRTRTAHRDSSNFLADRYIGLDEIMGLCARTDLSQRGCARGRFGVYCQQEWDVLVEYRTASRWNDSRRERKNSARDWRVVGGEWRG